MEIKEENVEKARAMATAAKGGGESWVQYEGRKKGAADVLRALGIPLEPPDLIKERERQVLEIAVRLAKNLRTVAAPQRKCLAGLYGLSFEQLEAFARPPNQPKDQGGPSAEQPPTTAENEAANFVNPDQLEKVPRSFPPAREKLEFMGGSQRNLTKDEPLREPDPPAVEKAEADLEGLAWPACWPAWRDFKSDPPKDLREVMVRYTNCGESGVFVGCGESGVFVGTVREDKTSVIKGFWRVPFKAVIKWMPAPPP